MSVLDRGVNPRAAFRRHRERGAKKFAYTYELIAEAAYLSVASVRNRVQNRLNAESLVDVVAYIACRWAKYCQPLAESDLREFFGADYERWLGRWPRFEAFKCAVPGCSSVGLESGLCELHCRGQLRFAPSGHIELRIGNRWIPLHRLLANPKTGLHVHHRNGNKYDNHPENLEILSEEEHLARHAGGIFKTANAKDVSVQR